MIFIVTTIIYIYMQKYMYMYIYIYIICMYKTSCSRVSNNYLGVSDIQETNPGTLCLDACEIHTG